MEWEGGPWGPLADSGVQAEQPHSWLSTALVGRAAKNLLPREEGPARREDTSGPGLRWRVPGLAEPENCSQASGARSEWAQEAGHVRAGWEKPRERLRAGGSELTQGPYSMVPASPRREGPGVGKRSQGEEPGEVCRGWKGSAVTVQHSWGRKSHREIGEIQEPRARVPRNNMCLRHLGCAIKCMFLSFFPPAGSDSICLGYWGAELWMASPWGFSCPQGC